MPISVQTLISSSLPPGFTGSQGDVGFVGSVGFTGSQGNVGFTGSQGVVGFTGSAGFTGSRGDTGFVGSRGNTGFTGSVGFTGSAGFTGSRGDTGFVGSKGDVGFTGSIGFAGSKGITEWIIKTTNHTAVDLEAILANTTGGPFTIFLPTPPQTNETIIIADGASFGVNNLTVDAGTGNTIENLSQTFILDTTGAKIDFVYDGSTWQIFSTFGPKGYTGSQGEIGYTGSRGDAGVGTGGIGVPIGGTENQLLTKNSSTDYDVSWQDPPATFTTGKAIAMAIVFG